MPIPSRLALCCALLCPPLGEGEDALPVADPAVTRAELEHHVRFLASDELGGRAPLTPGMDRAARYLARALEAAGVEPAGEGGTYFQTTGLERYEIPEQPRLVFTDESGAEVVARYGVDFDLRVRGTARPTGKLELRFFYDYNHSRMPATGNAAEALYFSASRQDKKRILEEKGIASLHDWGLEIELPRSDLAEKPGKPRDSVPARLVSEPEPEACELVELRGPLRADFERRKFTHVELVVEEVRAAFEDRNVVGRIRGAGTAANPALAQEVVVLSAHYDHLGIRHPPRVERADTLYNGADDDASGCAVLLELAQALAAGAKPARTLVFLFTTGEESGGRGSARYLRDPSEPLERTVADLNLEMLGRPDELAGGPGRLWLTGAERTNLGAAWQAAGLDIVPDPRPDENFFKRSDNYAFAVEGIVAQTLSSFDLHEEYHTPRDEPDTLDYAHLEGAAKVALRAATTLADGSLQPVWLEGQQPKKPGPRPAPKSAEEIEAERAQRRKEREAKRDRAAEDEAEDG